MLKQNNTELGSPQELVDCDDTDGGCEGGNALVALKWVKENGVTTETDYPYMGYDGTCEYARDNKISVTINDLFHIKTHGNETWLR